MLRISLAAALALFVVVPCKVYAQNAGQETRRRSFVLKDATINGALLAGTKFYENGEQRKFEAVFVNRTVASGKNGNEIASSDTKFGLGSIETGTWSDPQNGNMNQTRRVFLERR
jgi:hypothetical protein